MFVAVHEMRRLVGRFVLLTGAIALLVVLLLFFQSIAGALTSGLTGGIEHNQADVVVYSDKARKNPSASFLAPNAVDAVRAIDGVAQASGVAKAQFAASGSDSDIAVIGLQDPTIGGPSKISDGRLPQAAGEALASTPGLSSGDITFSTGDEVTIEGVRLTVVGTADGAAFDVSPTLYVTIDDLQAMNDAKADTSIPVLLNWVAVIVDDGADPTEVADRITSEVDYTASFGPPNGSGPPGGAPPGGAPPPGVDSGSTSVPTTGPESTTSPDQSNPEQSNPDQSTPDQSTPDQSTPDQSTPDQSNPDQSTPGSGTDSTEPDSGGSESGVPDVATTVDTGAVADTLGEGAATTVTGGSAPVGSDVPGGGAQPPAGGPPPGVGDAGGMPNLGGSVQALDRDAAAQALPGVDQISQSFNILYLLLFIVVTIVTGVFFLILTVQKQDSLVLMRALGATKGDVVRPVLIEVVAVVGAGSLIGVAVAGGMLYALRASFGSSLNATTTVLSVAFILVLGILASFGSVRRVLAVDPVHAARTAGE